MPHLKPLFILVALTLVSNFSAYGSEAGSLAERDWKPFSQAETMPPHPPGIGPVAEPNGFRGDLNVGPVVEPNGWQGHFDWTVSERVRTWNQDAPSEGLLEIHSSTIVEPNG